MAKVRICCKSEEPLFISRSALAVKSVIMYMQTTYNPEIADFVLPLNESEDRVKQIIKFMENGNLSLSSIENAIEMYILSQAYEIEGLQMKCTHFISMHIEVSNICKVHDFACQNRERQIQYQCWKIFDSNSNEIFKGEDFIQCSEITIYTLLSRPRYTELTEFRLFHAVYNWALVNYARKEKVDQTVVMQTDDGRRGFRSLMNRFLPMIRFLAMEQEELEIRVFPLNFLTAEEIQAIRTEHVTENISQLICSTKDKRTEVADSELYHYKNRYNLGHQRKTAFKFKNIFISEIYVKHDCFLTSVTLPTEHQIDLPVILEVFSVSEERDLATQHLDCKENGNVSLDEIIFLAKKSTTKLFVKILQNERTRLSKIYLKPKRDYYMTENEHSRMMRRKYVFQRKQWDHCCLDVDLYF